MNHVKGQILVSVGFDVSKDCYNAILESYKQMAYSAKICPLLVKRKTNRKFILDVDKIYIVQLTCFLISLVDYWYLWELVWHDIL